MKKELFIIVKWTIIIATIIFGLAYVISHVNAQLRVFTVPQGGTFRDDFPANAFLVGNNTAGILASSSLTVGYIVSTTTTNSYFVGQLGVGTTTPGGGLSATTSLISGTTTIEGGLKVGLLIVTSVIESRSLSTSTFVGDINANLLHSDTQLVLAGLLSCDTLDTDASGVVKCGSDETGGGGAGTLQDAYKNSAADAQITTTNGKDIIAFLADTTTDTNFIVAVSPSGGGQFQIADANGTATTTRLVITRDGSLGIGTTSPGAGLSVAATSTYFAGRLTVDDSIKTGIVIATSTVSIGTSANPYGNKLHISSAGDSSRIDLKTTSVSSGIYTCYQFLAGVTDSFSGGLCQQANDKTSVIFYDGDANQSLTLNNGFVGVSTSSPAANFAVQGDAHVSGSIYTLGNLSDNPFVIGTTTNNMVSTEDFAVTSNSDSRIVVASTDQTAGLYTGYSLLSSTGAGGGHGVFASGYAFRGGLLLDNGDKNVVLLMGSPPDPPLGAGSARMVAALYDNKFGVGTTGPALRLAVQGDAYISGSLNRVTDIIATGTIAVATTVPGTIFSIKGASNVGSLTAENSLKTGTIIATSSLGVATGTPYAKLSIDFTTGEIPFAVGSTTATKVIINEFGNLGLGILEPTSQLHVVDEAGISATRGITVGQHSTNASAASIVYRKSRGTVSAPTAAIDGDNVGIFAISGYDGTSYINSAAFGFAINGSVGVGSVPMDLIISVGDKAQPNFKANEKARLTSLGGGRFGVATSTPGVKMDVNGLIYGDELNIGGAAKVGTFIATSSLGVATGTPWGNAAIEMIDSGNEDLPALVVSDTGTSSPAFMVMNGTNRTYFATTTSNSPFTGTVFGSSIAVPTTAVLRAAYTATDNDVIIIGSGVITVNLPTIVGRQNRFYRIVQKATASNLTIDPAGSETIDGAATYVFGGATTNCTVDISATGGEWKLTMTSPCP